MFGGIVEELARVVDIRPGELVVQSGLDHSDTRIGDSIAINGACLTVTKNNGTLSFDMSPETMRRTTLGELRRGDSLHLERALMVGARLHGHFVTGHVDAAIALRRRERAGNSDRLVFELPKEYCGLIVEKGSVCLSGVSLTVAETYHDTFSVYVVPHTGTATLLTTLQIGQRVNLEVDILSRYIQARSGSAGRIDEKFLRDRGYIE